MSNTHNVLTPAGRLVMGSPFDPQAKDAEGRPLLSKDGTPRVKYFMGVAIRKDDPAWPALYATIVTAAREGFPRLFDPAGNCLRPGFAFKITDGDSPVPNTNGRAPNTREGFPGCWVLHFSNGFAPGCYARNETTGKYEELIDPTAIKCGYFVRVSGSVRANDSEQRPGVYLNISMVERVAYGPEIFTGPDANEVFGGAPTAAMPPGASVVPVAGAPVAPPGQPAPVAPPMAPVAPPMAPVAPVAGVAPAPDFLTPAAPPAEPKRLFSGVAYEAAALRANGWTEAQITGLPVA